MTLCAGLAAEAQQNAPAIVHFEGCVFPGRALTASGPVVAATSGETYVLTHTKIVAGTAESQEEEAPLTLREVAEERLRALNGKRVGVTGRIDASAKPRAFQVVSIREIAGTCPTRPNAD